ncbi:ATP-binding protein [Streptomyces sp. NPDC086777]|uniref:ATP-binding protein n=1 Tax=Streptomyces sp. NPDC086777 TaxID=3154866 RepID=UPI00344EC362
MDPNNPGPAGYGQDDGGTSRSSLFETGGGSTPRQRPPRDSLTTDFGQSTPAAARITRLVTGDFLLTVNPVDGSEIEPCPPTERPARPEKRTAAERAEYERAVRPPVPPGPARTELPLLERQDDRERLVRLLARGRSVRLTGPAGSGRTALLDLVADDCSDLAPDGVVRLNGFHRTHEDLLHDLFHAVYKASEHRPDHDELLGLVRDIGAVVVLDDIEFGGTGLDELIDATPECAFLIGATPDVPAPSADSAVEEVFLSGLDRAGGVDILERAVGRVLTEEEANWAGDLWFESEGLPLRFVQAGALLRQRDQVRATTGAVDEYGVFASDLPELSDIAALSDLPVEATFDTEATDEVPLPSLGEAAAAAPLLASRLSASARATLRFAVALGGEVPHQAHLPALVGDTHADAALGELAGCGLVSPVGSRYRLAAGVLQQLEAAGYADDAAAQALTAAQHYGWWAGHPSVTPERVCAESDAILAALTVIVPETVPPAEDEESTPVRLARTAAPAFAAGLHWSAWEHALRAGAEASRLAGEVGDQAYFHHELGIFALCGGWLDRARAELEASIGLRGALSDKRGTTAGRRALALVADRSGEVIPAAAMAGDEISDARHEESISPAGGVTTPFPAVHSPVSDTLVTQRVPGQPAPSQGGGGGLVRMARRNLVAVGAGVLLTAVLGTVVTLGMTSNNNADDPSNNVSVNPSASEDTGDGSLGADPGRTTGTGNTGATTPKPTDPGPDGTLGTSDDPTPPSDTETPSASASGTKGSSGGGTTSKPTKPTTSKPPTSPSSSGTASSQPTGGSSSSGTPTGGSSSSGGPTDSATPSDATNSASGPASNSPSVATSASGSDGVSPGRSTGTLI